MSDLMNAIIAAKLVGGGGGGSGSGLPPISSEISVIMPEDTLSFAELADGIYYAPTDFVANNGATYTITWDGVDYTCEALAEEGLYLVGNLVFMGGEDTGEPFLITNIQGAGMWLTLSTAATHTCSISGLVQTPPDGTVMMVIGGEWVPQSGYGYDIPNATGTKRIAEKYAPYPCQELSGEIASSNVISANSLGTLTFNILQSVDYPVEILYLADIDATGGGNLIVQHGGTTINSLTSGIVWVYNPTSSSIQFTEGDTVDLDVLPRRPI